MGWWDFPSRPIDVPVPTRHLDGHYLHTTLTDKIWGPSCIGAERVVDGFEISRLSRGLDEAGMRRRPGLASVVNTNSPLRVDGPMLDGLMTMARFGQCVIVTPFTLAGAMSPITLAGALAQQNAEALGVIAFLQMVAPGSALHVWRLHLECGYEERGAGLRHAGVRPRGAGRRPARAALRPALSLEQLLQRQCGRCPGRL